MAGTPTNSFMSRFNAARAAKTPKPAAATLPASPVGRAASSAPLPEAPAAPSRLEAARGVDLGSINNLSHRSNAIMERLNARTAPPPAAPAPTTPATGANLKPKPNLPSETGRDPGQSRGLSGMTGPSMTRDGGRTGSLRDVVAGITGGYTGLRDMVNGGGPGAAGATFSGGRYSGALNALGIAPMGSQGLTGGGSAGSSGGGGSSSGGGGRGGGAAGAGAGVGIR